MMTITYLTFCRRMYKASRKKTQGNNNNKDSCQQSTLPLRFVSCSTYYINLLTDYCFFLIFFIEKFFNFFMFAWHKWSIFCITYKINKINKKISQNKKKKQKGCLFKEDCWTDRQFVNKQHTSIERCLLKL